MMRYEWTPAIKRGAVLSAIGVGVQEEDDTKRATVIQCAMIQVELLRERNPSLTIVLARRPIDVAYELVTDEHAAMMMRPRVDDQCRYSKDERCIGGYASNCVIRSMCDRGHGPIPIPGTVG